MARDDTQSAPRSLGASLGALGVNPASMVGLARRPGLWSGAIGLAYTMARPGWWRRWPPRPWPSEAYLSFRAQTMFGSGDPRMDPETVVAYVKWWRRMRQLAR